MRKHLAAASAPLAVLFLALTFAAGTRSAHAQNDPASRALRYLQSQQLPDGSEPPGFSAYDATEFYAMGAAAAGYDPGSLKNGSGQTVMSFLAANANLASTDAGNTGRLVLAVKAAGQNPASFGGVDLISKLNGFYNTSTGAYQAGSAQGDALAILGLVAAGQSIPAAAKAYIRNTQDSDGGWDYQLVKDDPNAATNFDTSDTNSTAYVLMALDSGGDHSRDAAALVWLKTQQSADGGFPYQAGSGTDAISTAVVLQALIATGTATNAFLWCDWNRAGHTPYTALVALQDASGGYAGFAGVDVATSSQALAALLFQAFPVKGTFPSSVVMSTEQAAELHALQYLQSQQNPDGSEPAGFSAYDASEFYAIAAAGAGYDPNQLKNGSGQTVMAFLSANAGAASADAGNTGRLILAVKAAGQDPTAFNGIDLVAKLKLFYNASTDAYQAGSAQGDSLAILALAAAGQSVPAAAIDYLRNSQDSDGGWDFQLVKDDPNAATNFDTGDTNSTAFVLLALAAVGDHARDSAALAWLGTQQAADGGFQYQAGAGSDPVSTGLVLQALLADFQDPVAAGWTSGASTAVGWLLANQATSGGFAGYAGVDVATTSQAAPGLERVFFPVFAAYVSGTTLAGSPGPTAANQLPAQRCVTPTPAPSPSPSPTATPAPTPTPATASTPTPAQPVPQAPPVAQAPAPTPSPSPSATPTAAPSPSSSPTSEPTATPSPSASPAPSPPNGGPPLALYLGLAAAAAVLVVAGGAAYLFLNRP